MTWATLPKLLPKKNFFYYPKKKNSLCDRVGERAREEVYMHFYVRTHTYIHTHTYMCRTRNGWKFLKASSLSNVLCRMATELTFENLYP